jgi:tyrosinase
MDDPFIGKLARRLGTTRSRRQVLGTASKGTVAGIGAAMATGPLGTGLFGSHLTLAAQGAEAMVDIADFAFDPDMLEVDAGTTITWTNQDEAPHTVTADDASFDSGQLAFGATFSHLFDTPGTVTYHCEIHPDMVATVVVNEVVTPTATTEVPTTYVRPNAHGPDANLDAYAEGVRKMKELSETDPTNPSGWIYQANIHWTQDRPLMELWNTCEHHTDFFWTWHRMQIYWFEQIIREQSGVPTFALPYWDYSDPTKRYLPEPFRNTDSPLFESNRGPGINDRDENDPPIDHPMFDYCLGLSQPVFGHWDTDPALIIPGAVTQLESQVHDQIHGWVGGLMASIFTSPRDPIFWLHHCNMDRLWSSWKSITLNGASHTDPTDPAWTGATHEFFNDTGAMVSPAWTVMSIQETTAMNLGYEYEQLADNAWFEANCEPLPIPPAPPESGAGTPVPAIELGSNAPEGGIELGPGSVEVPIVIEQPEAGGTPVAISDGMLVLTVSGVEATGIEGVAVDVYVNLPADQQPDFRTPYYVGSIGTFALVSAGNEGGHAQHGATRAFDITRTIAALEESGEWTGELVVTFVGVDVDAGAGTPEAAAGTPEAASRPWITVESVTVTSR